MPTRLEQLLAEQARRQALERAQGGQGAGGTPTPATRPSNAPTVQETTSAGTGVPPALDMGGKSPEQAERLAKEWAYRNQQEGGEGIGVGKGALAKSMNAVMRDRGMDYNDRADAVIGNAPQNIYYGLKQITGTDSPEDVAEIEALRALREGASMDEGEGKYINAGTMGDIAGNVGAFAVPLGAAEQAMVKAGTALPRWASKLGAAMGVGGAEGAAQPVLEGESRSLNTAIGAATPLALSGAVQAVRKGITQPLNLSEAGKKLWKEGIVPTVGQGVETGRNIIAHLAKNIEDNLEGILPGVAGGRQRAEREVANVIATRATPPGAEQIGFKVGSNEYFLEADKQFDEVYNEILDNPALQADRAGLIKGIEDAIENNGMLMNPSLKTSVRRTLLGIIPTTGTVPGTYLKQLQKKVRSNLTKAASVENANENTTGAVEVLSAIDEHISDMLEGALGPDQARALREVDLAYANKMLLETAAGFKRPDVGHIPIRNLERAVRSRTGRGRRNRGLGLGQDVVDPAFEAMGGAKPPRWVRALSGVGLGAGGWAVPAAGIPVAAGVMSGTTRRGAKAMFGLYAPQKRFKQQMDEIVEPKIGTATAMLHSHED